MKGRYDCVRIETRNSTRRADDSQRFLRLRHHTLKSAPSKEQTCRTRGGANARPSSEQLSHHVFWAYAYLCKRTLQQRPDGWHSHPVLTDDDASWCNTIKCRSAAAADTAEKTPVAHKKSRHSWPFSEAQNAPFPSDIGESKQSHPRYAVESWK